MSKISLIIMVLLLCSCASKNLNNGEVMLNDMGEPIEAIPTIDMEGEEIKGYAQEIYGEVTCKLGEDEEERKLPKATVDLNNADGRITSVVTDRDGKYNLNAFLLKETQYEIVVTHSCGTNSKTFQLNKRLKPIKINIHLVKKY